MFATCRRSRRTRDAVLSAQPVRGGQALRPLDDGQLPRELRHLRRQRHPVQPRVAAAGLEFVTRKITDGAAKIKLGKLECIELGNLDARRDWGYAKEYVEGMYRMLQAPEPETFVLATGRTETVRDFATMASAPPASRSTGAARACTRRGRCGQRQGGGADPQQVLPAGRGRPADPATRAGAREARLAGQHDAGGTVPDDVEADLRRNSGGGSIF